MLIEADVKGLEVVAAAYLSGDKILTKELIDREDIHENNKKKFGLPTRLVAKTFKFRILYGGSAYAFTKDPEFNWISRKTDYWESVINEYYTKYKGLSEWHDSLMLTASKQGYYISPTGRKYEYSPYRNKRGDWTWPRTKILNYPVQGFGADLVSIARVSAYKRLSMFPEVLFVNSVHDSILLDIPSKHLYNVAPILIQVVQDIPKNYTRIFRKPFNIPMTCEVKYGPNWKDMKEYTEKKNAN